MNILANDRAPRATQELCPRPAATFAPPCLGGHPIPDQDPRSQIVHYTCINRALSTFIEVRNPSAIALPLSYNSNTLPRTFANSTSAFTPYPSSRPVGLLTFEHLTFNPQSVHQTRINRALSTFIEVHNPSAIALPLLSFNSNTLPRTFAYPSSALIPYPSAFSSPSDL